VTVTSADLELFDLEAVRLLLRGGSVIDWYRLNFTSQEQVDRFVAAHALDPTSPVDRARAEAVKTSAIAYLRRHFDFPIPKAVEDLELPELLMLAAGRGHRQLCACTILKVMHIIHHLEARELLFTLPISDQEVCHWVEQKVYQIVGTMLSRGDPILEFIGGRKNKDSLYTKLLSKPDTHAARIYDKVRFRIVVRRPEDVLPMLATLLRDLLPFNYVVPGESKNTLLRFHAACAAHPHLAALLPRMQLPPGLEERDAGPFENRFTASDFRVVHAVVDLPLRVPDAVLEQAPPEARALGPVVFGQAELQVLDRESEQHNEAGAASHDAYKARQHDAVARRLKLGWEEDE
jgi:uncharacterized protein (TIGR04552 family)